MNDTFDPELSATIGRTLKDGYLHYAQLSKSLIPVFRRGLQGEDCSDGREKGQAEYLGKLENELALRTVTTSRVGYSRTGEISNVNTELLPWSPGGYTG